MEERTQLNYVKTTELNAAADGWVYYVNADDSYSLYKMRYDGTLNTKITSEESHYPNIAEGWVYYMTADGEMKCVRGNGTLTEHVKPADAGDETVPTELKEADYKYGGALTAYNAGKTAAAKEDYETAYKAYLEGATRGRIAFYA